MSDTLILVWLIALSVAAVVLFMLNHFRRRAEWKEWRNWVAGDTDAPPAGQEKHGVLLKHMQDVEKWVGDVHKWHQDNVPNLKKPETLKDVGDWTPSWPGTNITPPPRVPKTP